MTLIEDAYLQLKELPIEFERRDIDKILFERAMRQLEDEEALINQTTIHGRFYALLSATVMKLEDHDYPKGLHYTLDYNKEKATFILRNRETWVPEDF